MTLSISEFTRINEENAASTSETTTSSLNMTTKTMTIMYEELEGAVVSYLETIGKIDTDRDFIIETDIEVALNEEGLVEFDLVTIPTDQLEFDFG